MRLFFKYWCNICKNNKALIIGIYCLTFLLAFIEISLPLFFRFFINKTKTGLDLFSFISYLIVYILCLLCSNLLNTGWYQLLDIVGGKIILSIRNNLFYSIENMQLKTIIETGREKLKNILFNDVMQVFASLTIFAMRIISNLLMLIIFLIVTLIINPVLGSTLIIMSMLGFLVSVLLRKKIKLCSNIVNSELKKTNAITNSFMDSIELFKTNNLNSYIQKKHNDVMNDFICAARKSDFIQVFLKNILSNINALFGVLTVCLILFIEKNISTGSILFLFFVSNMIFTFCTQTEQLLSSFYASLPSFEHIDSILQFKPKTRGCETLTKIKNVTFENISFYYNKDEKLLNNLNANFSCGEKIKISGKNGSGKTSFVKILASLIEPSSGDILINGKSINSYQEKILKQKILYISQDEYILNETIENYLKIMVTDFSEKEIKEAFEEWNFFEERKDLNIQLKNNAKNISGGQRKKLLAIRLFAQYKEADIIIIDEIEAGMDIGTINLYRKKRKKLLGNCKDKIIFEITHSDDDNDFFNRKFNIGSV